MRNKCAHAVRANYGQDIKKARNPTATSKELGTKVGVRNKSRVFHMPPALNTNSGWANHPSHPSSQAPGYTAYPHPHIRNKLTAPQGTCSLFSLQSAAAGAPVEPPPWIMGTDSGCQLSATLVSTCSFGPRGLKRPMQQLPTLTACLIRCH